MNANTIVIVTTQVVLYHTIIVFSNMLLISITINTRHITNQIVKNTISVGPLPLAIVNTTMIHIGLYFAVSKIRFVKIEKFSFLSHLGDQLQSASCS